MKTLALQKIIEKRNFLLGRIAHKVKQMTKNEISAEDFSMYYASYKSELKGYMNSLVEMEIITPEERELLWDGFIAEINTI